MNTHTALFYVFAAVLLFASFRVITARSPVYAALFLVLAPNSSLSSVSVSPGSTGGIRFHETLLRW